MGSLLGRRQVQNVVVVVVDWSFVRVYILLVVFCLLLLLFRSLLTFV